MKRITIALVSIGFILFSCTEKNKKIDVVENIYRPQLHFTPQKNWMNDPNGMFFYQGEYHLFYQHNPFGIKWDHMSWGHAVSKDMISWEHLPIAIPEENGTMIFSGSAVVDWNNTSGFGLDGEPPMVAIYTGYVEKDGIQNQSIAYSNDKGRTWTKYENNPVLDFKLKNFRDPKVFWYKNEEKWVMVVSLPMDRKIQFYSSKNLKDWSLMSEFGPSGSVNGQWECPDLFELTTEEGTSKWVLEIDVDSGSPAGGCGAQYFLGEFNGMTFTQDKSENINDKAPYIPKGKIIDNFEGDYANWIVEGEAFGNAPVTGIYPDQKKLIGFFNKKLVNSFNHGDQSIGLMKSKSFIITENCINFLIGGASNSDEVGISLFIDNKKVISSTGDNSENLKWKSWDVKDFKNKEAHIEIYDNSKELGGHIYVDNIVQSNSPAFNVDETAKWIDHGKDYYGGVSWSDIPNGDNRKLWIGWMNNWQYATEIPTEVWRSSMAIPRNLILDKFNDNYILRQEIVQELKLHRKSTTRHYKSTVSEINEVLYESKFSDLVYEIEGTINTENLEDFMEFEILSNDKTTYKFQFKKDSNYVTVSRPKDGNVDFHKDFPSVQRLKIDTTSNNLKFQILVDRSSVELFLQDGRFIFTNLIFPSDSNIKSRFITNNNDETVFETIVFHTY